jgi:glycosyltransferase involved in cell wall biosynthesis
MESSQEQAPQIRPDLQIAVIVPCRNEAACIAKVVQDFRAALPSATVFVYDNNSDDDTARVAREAGAVVRSEQLPGKGNVVRRMFADIDADVYVLIDGDDTYDAASAGKLVARLETDILDMVTGVRVPADDDSYRPGHKFGNFFLTGMVSLVFGNRSSDLLSGYRVFSRRFVKSFPALASGFEIETELTVHALELRMPIAEIETPYRSRPEGSESNLRTIHDGLRILRTIGWLAKSERPLLFFGLVFALLAAASLVLAWPLFTTFLETGLVPRFPTAVLATGLMLLAFLSMACGIILDTVTRGRQEMKRLHYLGIARHRRGARD